MNHAPEVVDHRVEVLRFLKSRFPIYHRSNIFFRDIQYGVQLFLLRRGARISYTAAESIARALVQALEREGVLVPIDRQSWAVNYPEFRTPQAKPAPAAVKPAAAAPKPAAAAAAPKPAAATPPALSGPGATPDAGESKQ
ncbi:MAG TPA: hypothetical protein VMM80_05550 [Bacteroidota bacterium]|nr:hypothetical protein [Bacteroidota bacterium]